MSGAMTATPVAPTPEVSVAIVRGESLTVDSGGALLLPEDVAVGTIPVQFRVSASPAPATDLTVCVSIAETGVDRVAASAEGAKTVMITDGSATVDYPAISWTDDSDDNRDSLVTMTVVAPSDSSCSQTSYTVSSSASSGSFRIRDNERTSLALSSTDASMTEGAASQTAVAAVTLSRRLYAGETLAYGVRLSTTTGARLPDGEAATPEDFTVSVSGTGVAATGLGTASPELTFTGHDTDTVHVATLTFTPTAGTDADGADEAVRVGFGSPGSATNVGGGAAGTGSVDLTIDDSVGLVLSATTLMLAEGGSGTYTVALASQPTAEVTVTVGGASGEVTVDTDTSTPNNQNTLTFTAEDWNVAQGVTVTALEDDDIADASGALTHAASGGGYDGVSVEVAVAVADDDRPSASDAASAWLPRFGRVVSEQILEGIGDRVAARRAQAGMRSSEGGGTGLKVMFAGQGLGAGDAFAGESAQADAAFGDLAGGGREGRPLPIPDVAGPAAGAWPAPTAGPTARSGNSLGHLLRNALANSSFNAGGTTQRGSAWGLWGRGSVTSLDGRAGGVAVDGDVVTGQFGADLSVGRRSLLGLSVSHSRGEGDYVGAVGRGAMESTMTALTPYLSTATDRFSAWGALSVGRGGTTLAPERGARVEADVEMEMGAAGLRGELADFGDGFSVSLLSDAMAMRSTAEASAGMPRAEAEASRIRAAVEASWSRRTADGGQLSARLEGGARWDGGDAEEGPGGEVSAGVSWMRGGLAFELEGRRLVTHEDDGFSQTGASAHLAWDVRGKGGLGPSVSVRRHWGIATASGLDQLFAMRHMGRFGTESAAGGLDAEFGWGLPLFGGRFLGRPFLLHGARGGGGLQTLGWRMQPLDTGRATIDASMAFKLTRRAGVLGGNDHGASLEARLRF